MTKKNIRYLMEYGDKLNVSNKIHKYIGMWLYNLSAKNQMGLPRGESIKKH